MSKLENPPSGSGADLSGRSEVVHVARGGGLNLAGSLVNTLSVLGLFWVLNQNLGQTLTGIYIQAFALRRILQTIALGGMRSAMTRFVAIHLADDDDAALRGTIAVGIAVSVGLATMLGLLLFFAAPWLATSVYGDPELVAGLRWVAVGLPSASFTIVVLSATMGWRTMRPNAIVGSMGEPIARVVLTAIALGLGAGLTGSLIMLQVASVLASVVAWLWLRSLMRGHAKVSPVYETGALVRFGAATWASSIALEGIRWADVQVLAVLTTADVVAEYQVATRTVLFCALAVNALTGALAPRAADLLRRGEETVLRRGCT